MKIELKSKNLLFIRGKNTGELFSILKTHEFEKLVPIPEHIEESSLNDWKLKHWGCIDIIADKRSYLTSTPSLVEKNQENIEYHFTTDTRPPLFWLQNVSGKFPELDFYLYFYEENFEFAGQIHLKNNTYLINETFFLGDRSLWRLIKETLEPVFGRTIISVEN